MFVVSALGRGQRGVVLHAYVEHVGRVAGHAAQEAGGGCHGDEGGEGGRGFGGGEGFFEFFVDAEAGCAVGQLAEEGGGELEWERGLVSRRFFFYRGVVMRGGNGLHRDRGPEMSRCAVCAQKCRTCL